MLLQHPEVPRCADCQRWFYDDKWQLSTRGGQPVPRTKGTPTPCFRCPKSLDGRPNPGAEMHGRNARIYELYLMIRAGMTMPDDLAVRRSCALIQLVVDRVQMQNASVEPLARALAGRK